MNSALSTRHRRNRHLRRALMASVMFVAVSVPFAASAQSDGGAQASGNEVQFNIPVQGLDSALTSIADQGGVRIFFTSEEVAGVQTSGVSGSMSVEQALSQALNGTGFGWRYREAGAIVIEPVPQSQGAIRLGPVRVEAASGGGRVGSGTGQIGGAGEDGIDASSNYRSAQSQAYLSQEQIQQRRGTSPGDFLRGIPGVLNGDNRNSGALDVNIRGMQGMDRVPVVIDGSLQQSTVYRGYSGVAGRTYLDPDLVGSISIEKGPSAAADGVGATGGLVRANTLSTNDLVAEDGDFGLRIKGGLQSNNTAVPPVGTFGTGNGTQDRFDRPNNLDFNGYNFSFAAAKRFGAFDLVAAYARRKTGNYFGGLHGVVSETGLTDGDLILGRYNLGEEVLNTQQNNTSYLLRGIIRPNDDMALDLSYMRYESDFGEMMPSQIIRLGGVAQVPPSRTTVDTYTGRYRWQPEDNPLIDLHSDLWLSRNYTKIVTRQRLRLGNGGYQENAVAFLSQSNRWGARLWNVSKFDTPAGALELSYGGSYTQERLKPADDWENYTDEYDTTPFLDTPRDGWRKEYSAYIAGELKPLDWVTLNASMRYTNTESHDNNLTVLANLDFEGYNHVKNKGLSPIVSFLVEPFAGVQLYGRYAQAIRTPSLFESTTGFSFRPDPRNPIVPERSKMAEFGVNLQQASLLTGGDVLQAKLAYFVNDVDDYLTRGAENEVSTVLNIDRARFHGIEANFNYDAGVAYINAGGTLYTFTEFCTNDQLCRSGSVPSSYIATHQTPEYTIMVDAGVRLFDERLTIGGRYNHVDVPKEPIVSFQSISYVPWPAYDVFDLYGSFDISEDIQVEFGVDNITDRYYMDALTVGLMPSPGRTVRVGFTGSFGGPESAHSSLARAGVADYLESKFNLPEFDGDWSGPFIGLQTGHGFASTKGTTRAITGPAGGFAESESADANPNGAWHGIYAGYNFNLGNSLVAGFDSSFSLSGAKARQYTDSTELNDYYACDYEPDDPCDLGNMANTQYNFGWMANARARLGFSTGRVLFYGAAGFAVLREKQERTQYLDDSAISNLAAENDFLPDYRPRFGTRSSPYFTETVSASRLGWTAGVGAEIAVGNNWSVKAEYNYSRFGNKEFAFEDARAGVGKTFEDLVTTYYGDLVVYPLPFPPYEISFYPDRIRELQTIVGTSDITNGRIADNRAEIHSVQLGVSFRF